MRIVTISNLYPGDDMPRHGIFVKERLRHLLATGDLSATVVALRPAFPGAAASRADTGVSSESSNPEIPVVYAPVPSVPKLSNWVDPWLWARSLEPTIRRIVKGHEGDTVIDAHFLYPDGVAASLLGKWLDLPVVLTARGSDVNVKCNNRIMRKWVQWSARHSAAMITVSVALANRLKELDIRSPVLKAIPNGVDLQRFRPHDKQESRKRFGLSGHVLVCAGHLIRDKGQHIVIDALDRLPNTTLMLVGEGRDAAKLKEQAQSKGVADRVRFAGLAAHDEMAYVYSAADTLVLLSAREGMPNVLLESLACGTRVVANDVGGVAEIMLSPDAGVMVKSRTCDDLIEGLEQLDTLPATVESTREFARRFSWSAVVVEQIDVYRGALRI